jgi:two-component system, sensor histidine kinase
LLHEEDFVLHTLILGVIDNFRGKAYRKGLGLSFNIDTTSLPVKVRGDPQGLRKAFSNLLSNSLENSLTGNTTITVKPIEDTETEATIEITIQDEGVGISEEYLDHIFEELDELVQDNLGNQDIQISDLLEHVGTGLVEATRFLQTSRGQLEIESEKGKGTTVSMKLPLLEASLTGAIKLMPSSIPINAPLSRQSSPLPSLL